MSLKSFILLFSSVALVSACASNKMKERQAQRDKAAHSSKMYCEFVNGDVYPDIDIALNIEMAKRCDSEKPFSLTQYKTPSESVGVIYCCSMNSVKPVAPMAVFDKTKKNPLDTAAEKKDTKKPEAAPEAAKDQSKEE